MTTTTGVWPELPLGQWKDTYETLHMYVQGIGKIRLKLTPLENHWWNVTLYVTPRGMTTSIIPYEAQHFQIDFDFIAHLLRIETTTGLSKTIALQSQSVAEFYQETMAALKSLGISGQPPAKFLIQSLLSRIENMRHMIPNMRIGSGVF
ncbi:MAG: DUF5996 family protein [Nitrososphaeraceae archaeon]